MVSKKLLIINSVILMLVFLAHIAATAFINYPWAMRFWNYIEWIDFLYLFAVLIFLALISWMVSTLKIGNFKSADRFLLIYSVLCGLLFGCFIYISADSYFTAQKAIVQTENQQIQQARKDIQNDHIIFRYAGGFAIPREWDGKIDSIHQKYGIQYQNTGCTVNALEIRGQEKYKETVRQYLEKRNGKGWENKMEREIERIKN